MTCAEIYKMITEHTDYLSVFICARNWANTDEGILIADNMEKDIFYRLFGDKIPTDWHLCCNNDTGWVELGFLF